MCKQTLFRVPLPRYIFKVQFNRVMVDDVRRVIYRLMNKGSISKINELIAGEYSVGESAKTVIR